MPSSPKRPPDQADDAGVPAGAPGPDTGIPSASPSETGALDGGDHSRDSAGASRPDTETQQDVSSSPVPASGALSLLGKQLPPVPSSTLRTSLDTEVPMEQRLQDPVTYSFAQDGNILLTNVMAGLPCLPKKLAQPLRSIQVGEIVELCLKFDVNKLTPPAFARIVEVYAIAKAKHLAQEIWEAKHLPKGARSMEKLTTLPEVEDKLPYMCASCFTSWILPAAKKCLHCGSTEGKVPTALPSASVTVDGVTWTMTFDADKQLCWQSDAPDLGDTQKSLCSVEVSSLGQKPPMVGATPSEVTFSELVSDSSRMTLRQEVLKRGTMRSSTRRSPRSPRVMDHDPGQETVTFHPTNVKAMRLVSELGQAERREKKEARVDPQMDVVYELRGLTRCRMRRRMEQRFSGAWTLRSSAPSSSASGRMRRGSLRTPSSHPKPHWSGSRSASWSSSSPPMTPSACGRRRSGRPWRVVWRPVPGRERPTCAPGSSSSRVPAPTSRGSWRRLWTAPSTCSSWSTRTKPPQVPQALIWGVQLPRAPSWP